jgi:hypothetical protein
MTNPTGVARHAGSGHSLGPRGSKMVLAASPPELNIGKFPLKS